MSERLGRHIEMYQQRARDLMPALRPCDGCGGSPVTCQCERTCCAPWCARVMTVPIVGTCTDHAMECHGCGTLAADNISVAHRPFGIYCEQCWRGRNFG